MQDKAKSDLKESFLWGCEYEKEHLIDNHPLRGINIWPEFQPNLKTAAMKYFNYADKLARNLMRGFALG